ncbi:MAG: NUDIX hydrolase [Acidimicrobiales bacterium]
MTDADPLRSDLAATGPVPPLFALSTVVYAERGDEILLLQRAEGSAMAGQWFLPGGMVEAGETPEQGARRELVEESGLEIDGPLELVGCYLMQVYGYDTLQLSYRGRVAEGREAAISHEHDGARWVRAADMQALLSDETIEAMAQGDERITTLLRNIRTDLDHYRARIT